MLTFIQEMFDRIDKEEDGEVYLREVVDYLAVLDNNIQQSLKVHSLCTLKYETQVTGPCVRWECSKSGDQIVGWWQQQS